MKRKIGKILILALALIVTLGVTASANTGAIATDPTVTVVSGLESVVTAAFNGTSCENLTVTYNAGNAYAGKEYMIWVLALDANGTFVTPNKDNADSVVLYVMQGTADSAGKVTFLNVYPSTIDNSAIVISGPDTNGLKKIADIKVPYILGDADQNQVVNSNDAMRILQVRAGVEGASMTPTGEKAADVDINGSVNSNDAMFILQYRAGVIATLPPEK